MASNCNRRFIPQTDYGSVAMTPKESHLLTTLVQLNEYPPALVSVLDEAMDTIQAQQAVRDVANILVGSKEVQEVSANAQDLYGWMMHWAGKPLPNR
jgi:hypothetical protein